MRAFTLIEVLIVLAIIVLALTVISPLGLSFYQQYQLTTAVSQAIQVLRMARLKAETGYQQSSYGVYFESEKFIFFKGDSYLTRDKSFDRIFEVAPTITFSGLTEVVFSKSTGIPLNYGTITISQENQKRIIEINQLGRINLKQ